MAGELTTGGLARGLGIVQGPAIGGLVPPAYSPPAGYRWAVVTDLTQPVTDKNDIVWDIERIAA